VLAVAAVLPTGVVLSAGVVLPAGVAPAGVINAQAWAAACSAATPS
jgi:hypothetical protein